MNIILMVYRNILIYGANNLFCAQKLQAFITLDIRSVVEKLPFNVILRGFNGEAVIILIVYLHRFYKNQKTQKRRKSRIL